MNEEKNRTIAEWLGGLDFLESALVAPHCRYSEKANTWKAPDFYADEAANALVLEKLSKTHLHHDFYFSLMWGGEWWRAAKMRDYHDGNADMPVKELSAYHLDRKTAIAEAALLLIERNNG